MENNTSSLPDGFFRLKEIHRKDFPRKKGAVIIRWEIMSHKDLPVAGVCEYYEGEDLTDRGKRYWFSAKNFSSETFKVPPTNNVNFALFEFADGEYEKVLEEQKCFEEEIGPERTYLRDSIKVKMGSVDERRFRNKVHYGELIVKPLLEFNYIQILNPSHFVLIDRNLPASHHIRAAITSATKLKEPGKEIEAMRTEFENFVELMKKEAEKEAEKEEK